MLYPNELQALQVFPFDQVLVGAEGFEPPTPCSQSRCATRLRYAPKKPNPNPTFVGDRDDTQDLYGGQLVTSIGGLATTMLIVVSGFPRPRQKTCLDSPARLAK